jgi:phosphate transport system substrate-binding protein
VILALLALLVAGGVYAVMHLLHRGSSSQKENAAIPEGKTSNAETLLRLSGSNTIGAQLGPDLVQAWLASKGATDLNRSGSSNDETTITGKLNGAETGVSIKAHGSATAFTDLAARGAGIGMASRKIKPQEAGDLQARGLGDLTSNADEKVVGLDGVAVIVNEANSKDSMPKEEVAEIFAGNSPDHWNVYARDDKSGTYDTFKDKVLGSRPLTANAKRFEDSRALVAARPWRRIMMGLVSWGCLMQWA